MKINTIEIENYRSISKLSFKPSEVGEKQCLILLGINEVGKSNILRAVALLDSDEEVDYQTDCNKKALDAGESILITYTLELEAEKYKEELNNLGFPQEIIDVLKIQKIERKVSVDTDGRSDFYHIYIDNNEVFGNFIVNTKSKEIKNLKQAYTGEERIDAENIKTLVGQDFEFLTKEKLEEVFEEKLDDYFEGIRPEAIFWRPSEKYLINNFVNLNEFKTDNSKSIPLRNIFHLAGISGDGIAKRIDLITKNDEKRYELQEVLSEKTTKYINDKWKEHKINILVIIEKDLTCKVSVEDKDNRQPKFKMNQRSDGFQQFVSILLNLSAENTADVLKNKIILLDEPETHLHPSGVKYLRDELLKISENNIIFVATHSIFMIDKKCLDRHYSVTKETSITRVERIDRDNPLQEEVIYEALGTSIYEIIKENIIVFEGRSDKDYFDFFTRKFRGELKPLDFYTIAASGVEKVPNYSKFLKDSLVKGFTVIDSDDAGRNAKTQIINSDEYFNDKVFEINDIYDLGFKGTLEDLLPKDRIMKFFKDTYGFEFEVNDKKPIVDQLKSKLKENRKYVNDDSFLEFKIELHKNLIKDLNRKTREQMKSEYGKYFDFISALHTKLKSV